ncbi:hypothetical protein CXZ10_20340 [Pleomorphomonas diazotrophica]|uniref:Uncharacterized protein n=1 Tax=Pleomorphomonas diazotrophica TaxID=1166257 RepID=A0A1I4V6S6_9HYPH|nr:hypothetical protein [Pleomorphomonas diazotrophica]PKR87397.1 hypothetical protein CXZ10_20340 [Pleomorphomonas diazotrophica]SFM96899.1 hypothetical protein SAMN05192571_110115 [Pleomorphomonas diazotrophica]
MASTVSICNLALGHLGADKIDALSEASSEARACNRFYGQTLDALLAAGPPWRFARHAVVLAEVTGTAATGGAISRGRWAHAYVLPADLIRVRELRPPDGAISDESPQPYELAGDRLYADLSPAVLHYIRRVDDPSKFPPLFVEALSWHLAARLAMPLTRDAGQRQGAFQMALQTQAAAAAADANDERVGSGFISDYERVRQ